MTGDIAIKVQSLTKSYRLYNSQLDRLKEALSPIRLKYHHDFHALQDLNFEVKKGETVGIIGKNGAGKSTLLKILTGVLTPTSGIVTINGRVSALLELGAGFNPELTGVENVYFNGTLMGYSKEEMSERLDDILSYADIGDFVYQPVKTYSSGMFVRLAFAVNTNVDPDVLIVDEALSVGDVFFQQKCYKRLDELRKRGSTIVFVTHSMGDVVQFCQRTLFLENGRQEYFGPSVKAVKRYFQHQNEMFNSRLNVSDTEQNSMDTFADADYCTDPEKFVWPQSHQFLDISKVDHVSNGVARCTKVSLCNENLMATKIFTQGGFANLFFEFELLDAIEVPIGGFLIRNEKNVLVHGKSLLMYNEVNVPKYVPKGKIIRFAFNVELSFGPGEYTIDVGLSTVSKQDYDNRKYETFQTLIGKANRLCTLSNVASFTMLRKPFQDGEFDHLHIGLCGIKSNFTMMIQSAFGRE